MAPTPEIFAATVSKMRIAQINFFRTRQNRYMTEAKDLEAQVDAMLRDLAPTNVAVAADLGAQTKLFG